MKKKGLILVDLQNDFFPGGALEVKKGDRVLPVIQELLKKDWDVIVASKDWHPEDHKSFATSHEGKKPGDKIVLLDLEQILWPQHCVQHTTGSEFAEGWDVSRVEKVFLKGTDPHIDSYSTFYDNAHLKSTGLADYLKSKNVEEVYLAGLATDYCVKHSALDAMKLGFETYVIEDACEGVNLNPEDSQKALEEIRKRGGHVIHSRNLGYLS